MREIKIDSTKREAAEEIMDLFCFKMENKNESVIGISIHDEISINDETGEISRGFTCYNDTPEIELIGQHDDEGIFGDVPQFENWTEKDKNDIVEYIEDVFFKEIYDENENENIYITFQDEKNTNNILKSDDIESTTIDGAAKEIEETHMAFVQQVCEEKGWSIADAVEAIATHVVMNDEDYII